MAKINNPSNGRYRRRKFIPETPSPADPYNKIVDPTAALRGLQGFANTVMNIHEETRRLDQRSADKKANELERQQGLADDEVYKAFQSEVEHLLTQTGPNRLAELEMNGEPVDIEAFSSDMMIDFTSNEVALMDRLVLPENKTKAQGVLKRMHGPDGKMLHKVFAQMAAKQAIGRSTKNAMKDASKAKMTTNANGIAVPRTDYSPLAFNELFKNRFAETATLVDALSTAGLPEQDLLELQQTLKTSQLSLLNEWSKSAHESHSPWTFYLGLMGDGLKVKNLDNPLHTVLLSDDENIKEILSKVRGEEDPLTEKEIESLKTLAEGAETVAVKTGYKTLLTEAGFDEDIVDAWISVQMAQMQKQTERFAASSTGQQAQEIVNTAVRSAQSGNTENLAALFTVINEIDPKSPAPNALKQMASGAVDIQVTVANYLSTFKSLMSGEPVGDSQVADIAQHVLFNTELAQAAQDEFLGTVNKNAKESLKNVDEPTQEQVADAWAFQINKIYENVARANNDVIPFVLWEPIAQGMSHEDNPLSLVASRFLETVDREATFKLQQNPLNWSESDKQTVSIYGEQEEHLFTGVGLIPWLTAGGTKGVNPHEVAYAMGVMQTVSDISNGGNDFEMLYHQAVRETTEDSVAIQERVRKAGDRYLKTWALKRGLEVPQGESPTLYDVITHMLHGEDWRRNSLIRNVETLDRGGDSRFEGNEEALHAMNVTYDYSYSPNPHIGGDPRLTLEFLDAVGEKNLQTMFNAIIFASLSERATLPLMDTKRFTEYSDTRSFFRHVGFGMFGLEQTWESDLMTPFFAYLLSEAKPQLVGQDPTEGVDSLFTTNNTRTVFFAGDSFDGVPYGQQDKLLRATVLRHVGGMAVQQDNVALNDPEMRENAKRATIFEDIVYVPRNEHEWDDKRYSSMSLIKAEILDSNGRLSLENAHLNKTEMAALARVVMGDIGHQIVATSDTRPRQQAESLAMWADVLSTDSNGERINTLRFMPSPTGHGRVLASKNFDGNINAIVADYEKDGERYKKPITLDLTTWDLDQEGDIVGNMAVRHHFGSLTKDEMTALRVFVKDADYVKEYSF